MPKKQPDTGTFNNAADEAELARIQAAQAAGVDVFGDTDDEPDAAAAPATADANAQAAADAVDDQDDTDDDQAGDADPQSAADTPPEGEPAAEPAAQQADAEPEAVAPAPQYVTPTRQELQTKRDELLGQKDALFAEFDEGAISREDYLKRQRDLDTQLLTLAEQGALIQANEQALINAQQAKLNSIKALAKASGAIDYDADESAAAEFDAAMQFVSAIPSNAKLRFNALADKAHAMVLAQRGIAAPQASQNPAPAAPAPGPAQPRTMQKPPLTLSGLPNAATANANGGMDDQLSRLHGPAFEAAIASMPKEKRDAWMDS